MKIAAAILSAALCMCAAADVVTRQSATSKFSGVRTDYSVVEYNGMEVFGSREKVSIFPDGRAIVSQSAIYPNTDSPRLLDKPIIFHEDAFVRLVLHIPVDLVTQSRVKHVWFNTGENQLIPAIDYIVFTNTTAMQYVIDRDYKILYEKSLQVDDAPPTTLLMYTDDVYPGTPGPDNPNGWQQFNNIERVKITDGPVAFSPIGWIFIDGLEGNNCQHICWSSKGEKYVLHDASRKFEYPIDYSQDCVKSINGISTAGFARYNYYHDYAYEYGFTEADGNFQVKNFTGQGIGNDSITLVSYFGDSGQNAFFQGNGIDGDPASITMLPFDNAINGVNRHSVLSQQVLWHEATHGTSHRLVGELASMQSRGMGEGWSDFVAMLMGAGPEDDPQKNYAVGGWVMWGYKVCFTDNYYYGVRRYPLTANMSKNPLTLGDMGTETYFVDPNAPLSCIGWPNFEVHAFGEIWSVALWECYDSLYHRYGFDEGKDTMLKLTFEGMKLCPLTPTFLQARDSIILADELINNGENRVTLWERFAKRGYGVTSWVPPSGNTENPVEKFDTPDWGDYNQDGLKDTFDFLAFNDDFNQRSYRSDLNSDNIFDMTDYLEFINEFNN